MYFLLKKYGLSYKGCMFVRFDIILVKTKPQGFQPYLKWSSYGGIWGAQFSKYLHYARGMVLHYLSRGQYFVDEC